MTATMTRTRDTHTDENGNVFHRWAITANDGNIAELLADINTAEISWVWVHENHRSEGHAARLYADATAEMSIYHAPSSHRTPEGDRWAIAVGGPSMPDCTDCCAGLDYDDEEGYW